MAARTGTGRITLIDPEVLAPENVGRHMLTAEDIGKSKVEAMRDRILAINPDCRVDALVQRFSPRIFKSSMTWGFGLDGCNPDGTPVMVDRVPDLIVSCVDSFKCESAINSFCLNHNIPAVYGGVWGAAAVGEILFVIPGQTPCYECFAGFRRSEVEIPNDPRKYTDPDFDDTKTPGQAGLWPNALIIAGMQFQVVLGVLGLRDCIDYQHTLWLMNVSDYDSLLQPLAVTFGKVKKGCAVCDESKLGELGRDLLAEGVASAMAP
jgi:molybdopterin/thiamine biosynthesis adenylyltransferase